MENALLLNAFTDVVKEANNTLVIRNFYLQGIKWVLDKCSLGVAEQSDFEWLYLIIYIASAC